MYAEWFKLEPVFEIGSLNSQGYLLIGLFTANFQMMVVTESDKIIGITKPRRKEYLPSQYISKVSNLESSLA